MQRWLHALHTKLKHKQCEQIAQKVKVRRSARAFVKWRNAFLWKRVKSEEFNHRQVLKNRDRKSEILEQLRQYAERKRFTKMRNQFAMQQYIYKLGKRVFGSLVRNRNESAAKNHLLDLLKNRIQTKCTEEVLRSLAGYAVYRRQRRRTVHVQTKQMTAQIKSRILGKWHQCY